MLRCVEEGGGDACSTLVILHQPSEYGRVTVAACAADQQHRRVPRAIIDSWRAISVVSNDSTPI